MTFFQELLRLKWRLVTYIGLYGLMTSALTATAILSGNAMTALTHFHRTMFIEAALLLVMVTITQLALATLTNIDQFVLQRHLNNNIRRQLVANIAKMSYLTYHRRTDAVYTSWLTNDMNTIHQQGLRYFSYMIQAIWQVLLSAIVLVNYQISFLPTVTLAATALLIVPLLYRKRLARAAAEFSHQNERLNKKISDVLAGFDTLLMANRQTLLINRITHASDETGQANLHYMQFDMFTQFLINLVNLASQLALLIQAGLLAYQHQLAVGAVVTIYSLGGSTFSGLTLLSFSLTTLKSVKPIFKKFGAAAITLPSTGQKIGPLAHALKIKQLDFTYGNCREPILRQLNLTISALTKIAVVGASGRGKTTLVKLLTGLLQPTHGGIYWDQMPYPEIDGGSLRNQITYIDQSPYLFNASIRFNITLGDPFTDRQLNQVLTLCQLTTFVANQPHGLETILSQNGSNISGGQKQRLVLARGLIRNRRLVITDESTAALDEPTAIKIEQLLVTLPNITLIMITHHLHSQIAKQVDRIIKL